MKRISHWYATNVAPRKSQVVGNPDFIHLEKEDGVWWLVDHAGKRFVTTGMNHVGEGDVLFNEVNKGWMTGNSVKTSKDLGWTEPRANNHTG